MRAIAQALVVAGLVVAAAPARAEEAPAAGAAGTGAAAEAAEPELPPPPINWADFHWKHKDAYGGVKGVEGDSPSDEPMAPPFVLALLNFGVFGFIVVRFLGYPQIKRYLKGRHDTIKQQLAEAARLRLEAQAKLDELSKRTANVNAEVDALIREIRADAESEKTRILDEARAQAAAMKKDAEERIQSEILRARVELEREVVAAAIAAAQQLLGAKTGPSDQQQLFDGFVASLQPSGGTPPASGVPSATPGDVSEGWS